MTTTEPIAGQPLVVLLNRIIVPEQAIAIQYHCQESMALIEERYPFQKFHLLRQSETILYHRW